MWLEVIAAMRRNPREQESAARAGRKHELTFNNWHKIKLTHNT